MVYLEIGTKIGTYKQKKKFKNYNNLRCNHVVGLEFIRKKILIVLPKEMQAVGRSFETPQRPED